ncbi:MAG: cysteine desulfurase [Oscillospiraceae bacterium]|jgi:cysteine desulfurase|nr:cysteine desulfurase [Oscillospiraceae bacterium]
MIYLDNAASTRVRDECAAAALAAMQTAYGNPSSSHALGRAGTAELDTARGHVAALMGVAPECIAFTSGGTEANNLAVLSGAAANRRHGKHVITSAAEHDSVLSSAQWLAQNGYEVTFLNPNRDGVVTAQSLADALRDDTALVSLMLVSNETGAVNPVAEYREVLKSRNSNALLHTDAVQAFGKLDIKREIAAADLASASAHKIHAAKGTGALYIRQGLHLSPRAMGGSHEHGVRAGTENVPGIAAFGEAARLLATERPERAAHAAALRELTIRELSARVPEARFVDGKSPFILNLALPGYKSEVLMNCLEESGICVSRSSACKKGSRSHVLEAMRLPNEIIDSSLRVSFSMYNTADDIMAFADCVEAATRKLFRKKGRA